MPRITALCLAISTLLTVPAYANPAPGGPAANPGKSAQQLLRNLDTDADGAVSLEEALAARAAEAQQHFTRLDTNGDRYLDEQEASARERRQRPEVDQSLLQECLVEQLGEAPEPRPEPGQRFSEADGNGDGLLEFDEILTAGAVEASARFTAQDLDANGLLSREELGAALREHARIGRALRYCVHAQQDAQGLFGGGPI